jgi:hypothetical protein
MGFLSSSCAFHYECCFTVAHRGRCLRDLPMKRVEALRGLLEVLILCWRPIGHA